MRRAGKALRRNEEQGQGVDDWTCPCGRNSITVRPGGSVGVRGGILGNEPGRTKTAPDANLSQRNDDVESLEDFQEGGAIIRVIFYTRITLGEPYFW